MSSSTEHTMQSPPPSINIIPPLLTSNDIDALVEDVLSLFNSRQYSLAIHYCEQGIAQTCERIELRRQLRTFESIRLYSQLILIDLEIEDVVIPLRQELASAERTDISGLGSMLRELNRAKRERIAAKKREAQQISSQQSDGFWKKLGKKIKKLF
ncbi:hypothetical protein NLG97_g640 [Lecanicillium saksenae]|uniref:Uncharacterized protein n=1 Tax=Lecanicillium saksenae TaxID=468837 RepID=A0ACC1R8L9_9HYPO|nr:hypothetical protein NLG97_g640 [Lecanicillium saksenae]